ncbi:lysostaphin resistance A-like protein [Lysinibacillus sp. NPDC096418]|uniref:CPBP family intramembrane glutamic endopeptidase n=1 Tax=Lysinibacillus sp. NPDC096418 TaxID=3364138 RepID=UPI00382A1BBA
MKYSILISSIMIFFVYLLIEVVVRSLFLNMKNNSFNLTTDTVLLMRSFIIIIVFILYLLFTKNIGFTDFIISYKYLFFFSLIAILILIVENYILGNISSSSEEALNIIGINPKYRIFNILIFAPIIEEIICRKFLLGKVSEVNIWLGLIISTIIFVVLHFQFNVFNLIFISIYGLVLGLCYIKTNSVINTIILHMIINTIQLSLYLLPPYINSK